jgi:outer membrane protein TolC
VSSSEQEASELLRLANEHYGAGIGLKADQLRASVFRSEAERRALTARNNLIIAQRRLALAIGQAEGEVEISAPLDSTFFAPETAGSPATERADLQAFALEVESLGLAVKRSQAAYLPRLDLSASYGLHNKASPFGVDGQAWRLGAILNWELFAGFRRSADSARVSAEKAAAVAELSDARREQTFRRAEVELRIAEARARKESAAQGLVAAEESQRLLQQRYESGLADLVDLLATQSALDQARSFLVSADISLLFSLGQALLEEGRFVSTILAKGEVAP